MCFSKIFTIYFQEQWKFIARPICLKRNFHNDFGGYFLAVSPEIEFLFNQDSLKHFINLVVLWQTGLKLFK